MPILISIIIPTYKPQDYILECFDSIRNQTFSHENIEVIVVLNGDREPYEQNIKNHLQSVDFNVNFIYTQEKGVSNARNIGIENAKGEYILFLDDDDLISTNYLTELYNHRTKNGIVASNVKTFTDDLSVLSNDYISQAYLLNVNSDSKTIFELRSFLSSSCCKLIPRELISETRFNPKIYIGEDSVFMFSISNKIKEIKVCKEPSAIYYRRVRQNSSSRKKKSFFDRIKISWALIKGYTCIYFKSNYSFDLYLSRIIGGILKIF